MATYNVAVGDQEVNLLVGYQDENEVSQVVFDFSAWNTAYGAGTIALSVQRSQDEWPYAVTMTVAGTNATWEISETDTAFKGTGYAQLTYTVSDVIKKSAIYRFTVYESLGANGSVVTPIQIKALFTDVAQLKLDVGTMSNLTTTEKGSLVGAINEVDSHANTNTTNISTNATNIGTLANLTTTAKTNLVGAVNEVDADLTNLKQDLESNLDYFKEMNYDTRLATLDTMGVGHFVSGSTPSTNGNYAYYRHTPLIAMQDITITLDTPIDSGLYMVVSLFDSEGNFVRVTRNGVAMTSATYSATVNWITLYGQYEEPYVRFEFYRYPYADITNGITVTSTADSNNVSVKLDNLVSATTDDMSITFDTDDFTAGYLNTSGATIESTEYKTSPFIAVNDQMEVTITKIVTTAWKTVFCYDSEQTLIKALDYFPKTTTTLDSLTVLLPYGTAYIKYVIASGQINATTVSYKMTNIPKHHLADSLMELWNGQAYGKMNNLFETATSRAMITIIDDDTASSSYVQLFHDACVAQGIKGSYAVIPYRFTLDNTLKDTLLGYEEEGFGMCSHCYQQDSKWNNPVSNISACEADMVQCIREMQTAGFVNFKYWLTPAGHVESAVQDLAKRLGMKCAVSSGWEEIETTQAKYGRYAIRRCSLEAADSDSALTVDDFKALIDEAVACNGWLLITTHFGNGEWDATAIANRFDVVVDYAQSKYMKFTTLQEAWETRRPIYEFYEKF